MDEFVKAFRHFITRDVIYVIGGSCIVVSFLYAFDRFHTADMPIAIQLFVAGVSYVLGYAAQEAFGLLRVTSTEHQPNPPSLVLWLFRRFTHKTWTPIDAATYESASATVAQRTSDIGDEALSRLDRIIVLKQVGTTMGACGAVSSVVVGMRALRSGDAFDVALSIGILAATVVLIAIAWVKRLDLSRVTVRLANLPKRDVQPKPADANAQD